MRLRPNAEYQKFLRGNLVFEIYSIDESYKQLNLLLKVSLVITTA